MSFSAQERKEVETTFKKVSAFFEKEYGVDPVSYKLVGRLSSNKAAIKGGLQNLCRNREIKITKTMLKDNFLKNFLVHEHLHLKQYREYHLKFGNGNTIIWCGVPYKLAYNVHYKGYYYRCGEHRVYDFPWEAEIRSLENLLVKTIK